ncbi:TIGR03620 family F420-dependent LLM class oxidoreductase [Parasphingorhabdus pacifica]
MVRTGNGRVGVTAEVRSRANFADDAVALEKLGYSTIWVHGGQLQTLDPLTGIIRATRSIGVGSAIIPAEAFAASSVAATYADIEETHPGRFIVGVGGGHGPRPLWTMNAYLDELDAAAPPVPASSRGLAALGPRKLELARERSGGAITQLITPEYAARARTVLGEETKLITGLFVVPETDSGTARETARGPLRFLSGIGGYQSSFRRMGFTDEDVDALSDRLVDGLVAWGDADAVAGRVAELVDAGSDQVVLSVLPTEADPDPSPAWEALAERLID